MRILMLTKGTIEDLHELCRLEEMGFSIGRWSPDLWAAELDGWDRHVVVAQASGRVIGCAAFRLCDDTAELMRVIVNPDCRGEGIGEELVEDGIRWARGRGMRRMMLEVGFDNHSALRLYERMGFFHITQRSDYYGYGRHAIVMERNL